MTNVEKKLTDVENKLDYVLKGQERLFSAEIVPLLRRFYKRLEPGEFCPLWMKEDKKEAQFVLYRPLAVGEKIGEEVGFDDETIVVFGNIFVRPISKNWTPCETTSEDKVCYIKINEIQIMFFSGESLITEYIDTSVLSWLLTALRIYFEEFAD